MVRLGLGLNLNRRRCAHGCCPLASLETSSHSYSGGERDHPRWELTRAVHGRHRRGGRGRRRRAHALLLHIAIWHATSNGCTRPCVLFTHGRVTARWRPGAGAVPSAQVVIAIGTGIDYHRDRGGDGGRGGAGRFASIILRDTCGGTLAARRGQFARGDGIRSKIAYFQATLQRWLPGAWRIDRAGFRVQRGASLPILPEPPPCPTATTARRRRRRRRG